MKPSAKARLKSPFLLVTSAAALLLLGASCSSFQASGPIRIAAIGTLQQNADIASLHLSSPTVTLFEATAQGLVGYDGEGQIEPGLAERWTVTTDGRSYIFRINEATWPDGKRVTAQQVAAILRSYLAPESRHPLRNEFVEVEHIHAMTDMVVEVRLSVPQPAILELFAHPSMGIAARGQDRSVQWDRGWGPMRASEQENGLRFTPTPDPFVEGFNDHSAEPAAPAASIDMVATTAPRALARLKNGYADAVIGGRYDDIFYFGSSGIARSRLQVDPALGLFGLTISTAKGFLAEPRHRAAISSIIRRDRLISAFGLSDWTPQLSLRQPAPPRSNAPAPLPPEWATADDSENVALAARLVAQWRADGFEIPPIRIALSDGIGSDVLFAYLASDLRRVGLLAQRVAADDPHDLRLIDEVAPNDDPIWALRRLNCRADTLCDTGIADEISKANAHIDGTQRLVMIAQAEDSLQRFTPFIPLAAPLRWSVSSQRFTGITPNIRASHPLNRMMPPPK